MTSSTISIKSSGLNQYVPQHHFGFSSWQSDMHGLLGCRNVPDNSFSVVYVVKNRRARRRCNGLESLWCNPPHQYLAADQPRLSRKSWVWLHTILGSAPHLPSPCTSSNAFIPLFQAQVPWTLCQWHEQPWLETVSAIGVLAMGGSRRWSRMIVVSQQWALLYICAHKKTLLTAEKLSN
jgi:hypothetical protein